MSLKFVRYSSVFFISLLLLVVSGNKGSAQFTDSVADSVADSDSVTVSDSVADTDTDSNSDLEQEFEQKTEKSKTRNDRKLEPKKLDQIKLDQIKLESSSQQSSPQHSINPASQAPAVISDTKPTSSLDNFEPIRPSFPATSKASWTDRIDWALRSTPPQIDFDHFKPESGAILRIDGEEVFRIRTQLGSFTPERRMEILVERLKALVNEKNYHELLDNLSFREGKGSTNLSAGEHTLLTITDQDAETEGFANRQTMAAEYTVALKAALLKDRDSKGLNVFLIACLFSLLATLLLVLSIWTLNWFFPRLYRLIGHWKGSLIRPLKIQQAELLSVETLTDLLIGSCRIVRVVAFLSVLSIYVSLVLSFFPETRPLASQGIHKLIDPILEKVLPAVISYIPNLIFILFIIAATYYVITFTHFIFEEMERGTITIPGFDSEWSAPTYKIARFLIITFALILLFPYLPGSGSPAFQQVSIFLGVLLSLGSTGALSHVIAGVFLTYTGALRLGDRVKIADTEGDVVEKTLLATTIRTIKNEYITIPNGLVLGNHIINYSKSASSGGLLLSTSITIGYDVNWQEVEKGLLEAASRTNCINRDPAPFVWHTQLADSWVEYQINAYTNEPSRKDFIYAELRRNVQEEFAKRGIELLSPVYQAIRDGNQMALPKENLPEGLKNPGFRVSVGSQEF